MLTLKQSPLAIIGLFTACSLADGEPQTGKLIAALIVTAVTVAYTLICINHNEDNGANDTK